MIFAGAGAEAGPEPEPFYFWRVGAGAAENMTALQLCSLVYELCEHV